MNTFKSIRNVLAGFITVAILLIATDFMLESLGIFSLAINPSVYVTMDAALTLFYRSNYTVIGEYVTARLALQNPRHHVYAFMLLGEVAVHLVLFSDVAMEIIGIL